MLPKSPRAKGVPTESIFLGEATARTTVAGWGQADLVLGNNVLAHVPALNDFVSGMRVLLSADGLLTMEFPHLVELMQHNQFDTIYHEHFSYFFVHDRREGIRRARHAPVRRSDPCRPTVARSVSTAVTRRRSSIR